MREGAAVFNIVHELLKGITLNQAVHTVITNPFYAQQVINALSTEQAMEYVKIAAVLDIFSRYGIIFLLFLVGLESSISELKHTGRESVWVAIIGILAPMLLGFLVAYFLLPEASYQADLFIAATLSATSIGITARVLSELNQLKTREARTILGAAMLDDVLGLILLAVVSSIVLGGHADVMMVGKIIAASLLFLVACLF